MKTAMESSLIIPLFFNLGTGQGGWWTPRPGRFAFETDLLLIVEGIRWVPRPFWTGSVKAYPLPRFDSRTVRCVASRYIDYAISVPTCAMLHITKCHKTLLHTAVGVLVQLYPVKYMDVIFVIEGVNKKRLVHIM